MKFINDDQEALYNTILNTPEDDAPRLVYSDWLEEHGEVERADFIRLQIKIARMTTDDPDYRDLRRQEQEMLLKNEITWTNELPSSQGIKWESFERGFVRAVRIANPETLELAPPDMFQMVPITTVRFHNFDPPSMALILDTPYLFRRVEVLDFDDGNRIGSDGLGKLVEDERFRNIRKLNLRGNNIGPAGVSRLANSSNSNALQELDLDRNDLFPEGARALSRSPYLQKLRILSLDRTQLGDDGVIQLLSGERMEQLAQLHLSGDYLGNGAATQLGTYPFRSLEVLFLNNNVIEDSGGRTLLSSEHLQNLRYFYLRHNRLSDEVIPILLGNRHFLRIKELVLGENRFSDAGNDRLREHFQNRVMLY